MNTILAKLASIVIAPFILIGGLFSPEPIVVPENPAPIIENQSIPVGGGSGTIEKLPQLITSKDEGTTLTSRTASFDFVGAGVSSSNVGNAVTVTISGGGGGGGTDVALDLGDNGSNESSAISEIAITGDTNSIFTEPSADKLLIAVGNDWPKADVSDLVTFADAGGDTTTFVALGTSATGNLSPATDAGLSYNATTNALTATTFIGGLTGNASTATALAANGANCSAGSAPLGVDASGAVESCTTYEVPLTFSTGLTRTTNTITVNTSQNIATLSNLTSNGFVKTSGGTGALSIDTNTYLTGNQSITLSGDVSGSGSTAITTTIGADKILESMLKAVDTPSDEECLSYESTVGDFEWQACGSGGGTPGGSDTQIQFNDGGSFGGDAGLVYDKTTDALTLAGIFSAPTLTLTGTGTINGLDAIDATTETTLEGAIDIAGDISGTGLTAVTIGADKVLESMLKSVDAASDEECLTYESTVGDFEWQTCGAGGTTTLDAIGDAVGTGTVAATTNPQTWTWDGSTTTNGLTLSSNSLTTGMLLNLNHDTSVLASGGSLLDIISTGVNTGTTKGTLLNLESDSSTTGIVQKISFDAATSGVGLDISSTSGVGVTNLKGINVALSGANNGSSQITYGGYFANTRTGTTSNSIGLYSTTSGASLITDVPLEIRGHQGGGLRFGNMSSTIGAIWPGDVTPTTSNWILQTTAGGNFTDLNNTANVRFTINNSIKGKFNSTGLGVGSNATPTAQIHVVTAGSATASTAPLKFTSGTLNTTAEAGAFEYLTPSLYFTNGSAVRQEIPLIQQSRVSTQFDKTSDTTLANVTGLTASLNAGKFYKFKATLYTTANVAGGVKAAIAGTATATTIIYEGLTTDAGVVTQTRATALGTTVGAVTTATAGFIEITGYIQCNASGTLTVQFAQNASNGTASSVLVGSDFQVQEIR